MFRLSFEDKCDALLRTNLPPERMSEEMEKLCAEFWDETEQKELAKVQGDAAAENILRLSAHISRCRAKAEHIDMLSKRLSTRPQRGYPDANEVYKRVSEANRLAEMATKLRTAAAEAQQRLDAEQAKALA
jgi:hypothetical protein